MFSDSNGAFVLLPVFLANAGTPLMWAGMLHLVFGNAVIGIIEAWLVSKWFGLKSRALAPVLIVANYASATAGYFLLTEVFQRRVELTIENLLVWMVILIAIAFVLTLIVEFPFFWAVLRRHDFSFAKIAQTTMVVHLVSYALILGGYWLLSSASLTKAEVTSIEQIAPREEFSLFYIAPDGKEVFRMNLKTGNVEKVISLNEEPPAERLFVKDRGDNKFDLVIYYRSKDPDSILEEVLISDFAKKAVVSPTDEDPYSEYRRANWHQFGKIAKFDSTSDWESRTGFYGLEGIRGRNDKTGERFRYALETPIASWLFRNAVQLEDELLLFQLGDDQICLLRPMEQKLALIARGKGPVAAVPVHPEILSKKESDGHRPPLQH